MAGDGEIPMVHKCNKNRIWFNSWLRGGGTGAVFTDWAGPMLSLESCNLLGGSVKWWT